MARVCQLTGKKTQSGNNRPFSLKATKRKFRPNLFTKRVLNPITGKVERMKLSAKAIRTLKKWSSAPEVTEKESTPVVASKAGEGKHVKKEKLTPVQKKAEAAKKEAEALGKQEEQTKKTASEKETKKSTTKK